MNIALFHNVPPGGAKRVIYEQVKFLSKKHKIDLFEYTSTEKSFLNFDNLIRGKSVFNFDIKLGKNRFLRDLDNFIKLNCINKTIANLIDRGNYDVCLVHPDKFTQAPFLLKHLKTPSVYFCEELLRIVYEKELAFNEDIAFFKKIYENITRKFRKHIDAQNAKSATLICTGSEYIKRKVEKAYKKKAVLCPLGVNALLFRPRKTKKTNKIFFVGDKHKVAGYYFAQQVIKFLGNSDNKLDILSFKNNKPGITDENLSRKYSRSMLTLCVSYHEPFGLVAIESMACGTPVLAVNEGGYTETVVDNKTGYLLPRDPKIFAEKIKYLAANPKILKTMEEKSRNHVVRNFTWEKNLSCLEKCILNILK